MQSPVARSWSLRQRLLIVFVVAGICAAVWDRFIPLSDLSGPSSLLSSNLSPLRLSTNGSSSLGNVEDAQAFLTEQQQMEQDHKDGKEHVEQKLSDDIGEANEDDLPPAVFVERDDSGGFDDDEDEDFEPAPRTHEGLYNEINPNERYFIYSPSGGFNNQREELINAIEIARILNRTLYVPMAARHTNFFSTYEHLHGPRDLFSMDRILDFPFLETYGVKLVPLNITITHMVARFIRQMGESKVHILFHPEAPSAIEKWHKAEVYQMRAIKKNLLFIRGRGFYHRWFSPSTMTTIRKHTRYSEYLRQLAMRIVNETFGRNFYAMHIRLGDYKSRYENVNLFIAGLVKMARNKNWKMRKYPVYIATDDPKKSKDEFGAVYSSFDKIVFADDIHGPLLREFRALFPKHSKMANDMMGILEQLICAQALDFVGTSTSTFSSWISTMRALRKYSFPEIGAVAPPPGEHDEESLKVANGTVVKVSSKLVLKDEDSNGPSQSPEQHENIYEEDARESNDEGAVGVAGNTKDKDGTKETP